VRRSLFWRNQGKIVNLENSQILDKEKMRNDTVKRRYIYGIGFRKREFA
jgi:hypothetical protein